MLSLVMFPLFVTSKPLEIASEMPRKSPLFSSASQLIGAYLEVERSMRHLVGEVGNLQTAAGTGQWSSWGSSRYLMKLLEQPICLAYNILY